MESESLFVGTEIKQENVIQKNARARFREIVKHVLEFTPVIKNIKLSLNEDAYDGIMSFEVPLDSLGLDLPTVKKYSPEIFTNRFANIIAEIIIRENISVFIDEMMKMDSGSYKEALSSRKHENFGMKVKQNCFLFDFHVSMLHDIAMSDFKSIK